MTNKKSNKEMDETRKFNIKSKKDTKKSDNAKKLCFF